MNDFVQSLDWGNILSTIWTVVLLPLITLGFTELNKYLKAKKLSKYTEMLYEAVENAVKDICQTVVDEIKNTDEWTEDKKAEVKELAMCKVIQALSTTAYQFLKEANTDFEEYLSSLIEATIYDYKK